MKLTIELPDPKFVIGAAVHPVSFGRIIEEKTGIVIKRFYELDGEIIQSRNGISIREDVKGSWLYRVKWDFDGPFFSSVNGEDQLADIVTLSTNASVRNVGEG